MRATKPSKEHFCAVTLLSRPPAPTVLVGPAHCTYLCKSSRGLVDNCCCGGPNDCSSNNLKRCGENPEIVQMTGDDAEIICGEWETGTVPPNKSGEKYNVVMNIKEVIRHPDYSVNINSSAYLANDIAVFKVNDKMLSKFHQIWKIYPACLPTGKRSSTEGFHSGWSSPIPFNILRKYAPGFTKVYRDFFKQIHYKMEIFERCADDNYFIGSPDPVFSPTDTFYPPGIKLSSILSSRDRSNV